MEILKRLLLAASILFVCTAQAQTATTDVELGVKGELRGEKTPYADVRFNFRVGPQVFGQDAYIVLEPGIMFVDTPSLWVAGEFILDGAYTTEFARFEYTEAGGIYFRTGIRFGF